MASKGNIGDSHMGQMKSSHRNFLNGQFEWLPKLL